MAGRPIVTAEMTKAPARRSATDGALARLDAIRPIVPWLIGFLLLLPLPLLRRMRTSSTCSTSS